MHDNLFQLVPGLSFFTKVRAVAIFLDFESILRSTFEHSELNFFLKQWPIASTRNPMLQNRRQGGFSLESLSGKRSKSSRNRLQTVANFGMMWQYGVFLAID
jgi:hypothetical protein